MATATATVMMIVVVVVVVAVVVLAAAEKTEIERQGRRMKLAKGGKLETAEEVAARGSKRRQEAA